MAFSYTLCSYLSPRLLRVDFLPHYSVLFLLTSIQLPSLFSLLPLRTFHCHLPSLLDPLPHTYSFKSRMCVLKTNLIFLSLAYST